MSDFQNRNWVNTGGTPSDKLLKPTLSRAEFIELVKIASTTPCPSRSRMISERPSLEIEANVSSALDAAQSILSDNKNLAKQGELTIAQFRNILERHGFSTVQSLSPSDAAEVGKISIQTEKRCIESRIGRSS